MRFTRLSFLPTSEFLRALTLSLGLVCSTHIMAAAQNVAPQPAQTQKNSAPASTTSSSRGPAKQGAGAAASENHATGSSISSTRSLTSTVPSNTVHSLSEGRAFTTSTNQKSALSNRFSLTVPQEYILPNGLRVLILEDHSFPVVSCSMWYRVGSRNDPLGTSGLSHLVEHLLFRNVGTFKKNQLAATIVANGGQFNGFTSEDFTAFYTNLPANKYELAVRGEAERMREARFTKQDVASEVSNLVRELDEEGKDPVAMLDREVHATAFEQHPYQNPPGGWKHDLARLSYDDARWLYDRFYHPDNATIVLTGDLKTSAALSTVKKYFSLVPKAPLAIPSVRAQERPQIAEKRVIMKAYGKKEAVVVAYHAPSASDPEAPAMTILEKLLNSQISGRLRKQLIDSKICSSAQAAFELKRDPSLLTLTMTALAGSSATKVLEVVDSLIAQLRNQAVSEADLTRAKKQAEFEFFNQSDGPFRTGFHLGMFESLLSWQTDYAWTDKIRKVSASDIQRVANIYLNNDARVVGFLNPSAAAPPAPKVITPTATGKVDSPTSEMIASASISEGSTLTSVSPIPSPLRVPLPLMKAAHYKKDDSLLAPFCLLAQGLQSGPSPAEGQYPSAKSTIPPTSPQMVQSVTAPPEHTLKPAAHTGLTVKSLQSQSVEGSDEFGKGSASVSAENGVALKTLGGGIRVIVIESHLNPLVEIFGSVKAGSVFEPADKRGISSLLATLLNYGSGKFSRQQLITDQDDLGLPPQAMLHFESGLDNITFQTRCLAPDCQGQLTRLANCLKDPRLNDTDFDKARQELISVLPQTDDNVRSKVQRALLRNLATASSKFVPPDPNEKARMLANLKLTDISDFYANSVTPKSLCLVIAGDVSVNQVCNFVESAFVGWNSTKPAQKLPSLAAEIENRERHALKSSIPLAEKFQSLVCLGRVVPLTAKESEEQLWPHLLLADCALTNHPIFSHINHRLGAEPALSSAFSSDFLTSHIETLPDASIWTLFLPMDNASASQAVQAIQNELNRFAKSGLTQEELIESKRYLLGHIPVAGMSDLDSLCHTTLDSFEKRDELSPLAKTAGEIRSATLEAVNRFVENNFKPDQAALIVAGNKQIIRQLHPTAQAEAVLGANHEQ
jgi:zinc protease